jgi:hypothetical protein
VVIKAEPPLDTNTARRAPVMGLVGEPPEETCNAAAADRRGKGAATAQDCLRTTGDHANPLVPEEEAEPPVLIVSR